MRKSVYLLFLIVSLPLLSLAQRTITGKVTASVGGGALSAVNIVVEGNARTGATTNADGTYSITVPANSGASRFSFVGKTTVKEQINGRSVINVQLADDASNNMADVVVVGYTSQQKVTLTGAVATIKGSDMVRTKNENAINMLTGKLPGVRVSQKSSRPGAYDATIVIRGMGAAATNSNGQPSPPLFVIDGVVRDKDYFARMSSEEIESISVLKDGSAAIYGMRAANGVIVVTTKTGKAQNGKVDITLNSSVSNQKYLYIPEGVNAVDYYTLRNEQWWQSFNDNYLVRRTATIPESQIQPYRDGTKQSYDWMDKVFRKNTPQYETNLSVDGGTEKLRFYFNLGYTKQGGSYKTGDLNSERWSLRSNLDAQISKRLKAKVQIGALMVNTEEPTGGAGWTYYKISWLMRPDAPWYSNDNPDYLAGDGNVQFQGDNTVAMTDASVVGLTTTREKRYNGTLRLEYEIPGIKGLSAKAMYDYTMSLPDVNTYRRAYNLYTYNPNNTTYSGALKNNPSRITKSTSLNYDRTMQGGLYYTNSFSKHNVNAFVLYEQTYITRDGFNAQRDIQVNSQYLFAGEQTGQSATGSSPFDRSSKSLVGALNYNYDRKYLVDIGFRYEGSSRFPAGKRFGFFPTVSLGWRLSEEGFIKDKFNWLSELKLRASYGELGDDASAGNYPPVIGYNINGDLGWYFGDVLNGGVAASDLPNPNLTWYKAKSYNAGLDFGLFKNKITGTIDVFKRDRSGLLARRLAVVPGTVGAQFPLENFNGDRNFGYEFSVTYRNRSKDFSYYATGNISATKFMRRNWLETPATNSWDKWRNRTANRYQNIWWGNESGGMFNSLQEARTFGLPVGQGTTPGDWWLVDYNGDGIVDGNDNHPIGTTGLPIFNYGISLGASWKNFDIALDWQGAYGVNVQYGEVLVEALGFGGQNTLTWFMDRWRPEDPNADYFSTNTKWIPGYYPVTGHDGRRTGTNGVMNASYIRLKTVELGYNFNSKLLSRAGIKDLRVFVSGYNVLTFTPLKDVDP